MLTTRAVDASNREAVDFKIVADRKPVQEMTGSVLNMNERATTFAFGDASTLTYLKGVQRIWVRVNLPHGVSNTISFPGGSILPEIIGKTLKACGVEANRAFASTASKQSADEARIEGWFKRLSEPVRARSSG